MKAAFILRKSDSAAVSALLIHPFLRFWGYLNWIATGLFWPLIIGFVAAINSNYQTGGDTFVLCIFLGIACRLTYYRYYKRTYPYRWFDTVDVEVQGTITPEWLLWEKPRSSVRYSWAAFSGVRLTSGYVRVQIDPNMAYFVPRRAFEDEAQMQELAALAEAYYRAARASAGTAAEAVTGE